MPQTITRGYKTLLDEANAKVRTVPVAEAVSLHGREDVVFVDLRDPRELEREGRIPGANGGAVDLHLHALRNRNGFLADA